MVGGGGSYSTTRPTTTDRIHHADFVLLVDHEGGPYVYKNRYSGITGGVSTKALVKILCRVLVEYLFNGRMKMFQVGMQKKLEWTVNRIIKRGI